MTTSNDLEICTKCHPEVLVSHLGFWAQLKQVMHKQLEVADHHALWALAAGLVFPMLYLWPAVAGNPDGTELVSLLGTIYVALTALFALLSASVLDQFKAVMPPLIISSTVTTIFLALFTFIDKVM